MTREEAIRVLRKIKENIKWDWDDSNLEALDIAIESLKNEGRKTNLEHYALGWDIDCEDNVAMRVNGGIMKLYHKSGSGTLYEWLTEPYEGLKCRLTKFEYDLLKLMPFDITYAYYFNDYSILTDLQKEGHFKNVPQDLLIKDILANCEVSDDD